jgi:hypothetical protein
MQFYSVHLSSERGSAGTKFFITLVILFLVGHAGYNYIPVAYEAESLRTEMQTAVLQGLAMPGKVNPVDTVKTRIAQAAQVNGAPPDSIIDVKMKGQIISARVAFDRQVNILPFGLYRYVYKFDNTATPSGFLTKELSQDTAKETK